MTMNKYNSSKRGAQGEQQNLSRHQGQNFPSDSSKSSQAARMAQELASQNSWADTYAPRTPSTTMTPETSTVAGDDDRPVLRAQDRSDDPPPAYDDASHNLPELSGEPSRRQPSGSIPNPVRSSPDTNPPGADAIRDEHQPLLDVERLGPVEGSHCRANRGRREMSKSTKKQRRRRFRLVCSLMGCIFLGLLLIGRQSVISFSREFFSKPQIPIPGRNYTRHETSQSISGTFTFYDLLDLSTESGSISITLDPQPGDKPAVLRLSSQSGSIKVDVVDTYRDSLRKSKIAQRPWNTEVRTSSGSIKLKMPIGGGSTTSLEASSASINAKFFAANLGPDDEISYLSTESSSGSQDISVESLLGNSSPITNLAAKLHVSGSATQKVSLPQSWQGVVHASVVGYGNVKVQGEGLEFQRQGDREIFAWRGKGEGIQVKTEGSAGIKVDCSA